MSNLSSSYKDLKDLFKPFFKKNYPSPRSIIHKFASSKVSFKEKFYRKVQNGFLRISKNKKRYKIINSNLPIELNKKKIIEKIEKLVK